MEQSEAEFRTEVRAFLAENLPRDLAERTKLGYHQDRNDIEQWTRVLAQKQGWSVPSWPVEYGGLGWTIAQRHAFDEECYIAGAPALSPQGTFLTGPIIIAHGSEEQKARFLPPIRDGIEFWAQGFSEPEAGSDLASLKTAAVRDGDEYVINGTKIWTSHAHQADWLFLLARTRFEGKPQAGISMFLVDMKSPGISVRPIISIDGRHSLNQVFMEDVRVPVENRVGEENMGWTYAKETLVHERTFNAEVGRCANLLSRARKLAENTFRGRTRLIDDERFACRLAELEIEFLAHRASLARTLAEDEAEIDGRNLSLPSMLKIKGSELVQQIGVLMVEALGDDALPYYAEEDYKSGFPDELPGSDQAPGVASDYLFKKAMTIYGGSNEIQRNLIANEIMRGL
ncbi:acyl-CoA dehydrogenase family protein [Novosphingobium pentaromativorans]|uniref:Acyl-CoA dehydrogenase n=1 Tax=Novosphingobium pentaromativorans US6-1 TaxID=1088721 RepID=G6E864_9SPHN|nr:acyl-CoA dehydrogenase family protein [Novosphingobium pentaromativorans]AIT81437.1 acyl-CoA dehydrogenase [Novosphingobium pentaromativorans US6-1]EHJ62404.1 hypothetical protein NSU_0535 [Novosphingobium pentaromativorans US6-1]